MNDLQDLYREVILDHNRQPRNFGPLESADKVVDGVNPLCGDKMRLYVKLEDDRIADISFEATGCAISVASTSLMTERVKGKSIAESLHLYDAVHGMLTDQQTPPTDELGKLAALSGVKEFPSRVKCASLAWHALKAAITGEKENVSTE
jgi:nitrogen fixation NifU-like protein